MHHDGGGGGALPYGCLCLSMYPQGIHFNVLGWEPNIHQ